ncbi:hypothetical protein AB0C27_40345 [Nonomuraea sp. NPDC048882]|uniref:hypothetical protein n=1 Tax=Nonomuraea sp. NPDC048882 TaxID=3154347 RepID=UPI0033FBF9A3
MRSKKNWIIGLAVAFALFYLLSRPAQAAEAVNGVIAGVINSADQLAVFLNHLG